MATGPIAPRGYRLGIASRAVVAILGSYVLAVLASMAIAASLAPPLGSGDAVAVGQMIGFLVYTGAVIWAFACRSGARAWAGIGLATALSGLWLLIAQAAQ